ncbi:MAG: hypothetical protein H7Y03_06140, partial [Chitinophagaceae bacterium]|nr:hypothetical protein [Chitinophagaceae bacterium]
ALDKQEPAMASRAFNEALGIKPSDPKALAELRKINAVTKVPVKAIGKERTLSTKETRFRDSVALADNLFESGLYSDAKRMYKAAYKIKPTDMHISRRLISIDSIDAKQKLAISDAKKDSLNAILYNREMERKNMAQERAALKQSGLNKKLEEEAENKQYILAIRQGYAALKNEDYQVAKDHFTQARKLKPNEMSPLEQLEIINRNLEEIENNRIYESFIHLADSSAFTAKDYLSALRFYDSALVIKPNFSYPRKQKVVVKTSLLKRDSTLAAQKSEKIRTAKYHQAMIAYRSADTARLERKYERAYMGYSEFLQSLDTLDMSKHHASQLYHINLARDFLKRLEEYKPKPQVQVAEVQPAESNKKKKRNRRG